MRLSLIAVPDGAGLQVRKALRVRFWGMDRGCVVRLNPAADSRKGPEECDLWDRILKEALGRVVAWGSVDGAVSFQARRGDDMCALID